MRNLTLVPRAGAFLRLVLRLAKTAEEQKNVPNTQDMGSPQEINDPGHGVSDHPGNDASLRKFVIRKYLHTDKTPGRDFSGERFLRPLFWNLSPCAESPRRTTLPRPAWHANRERLERWPAHEQSKLAEYC